MPSRNQKYILPVIVLVFFLGSFLLDFYVGRSEKDETVSFSNDALVVEIFENPFAAEALEAKAALVWDVQEGKAIYSLNEEAQLPLASLTKVMTALVAKESLRNGSVVSIGEESLGQEGDSGLFLGEEWLLEDLIDLTLLGSSNDGAHALASAISYADVPDGDSSDFFIKKMNRKAEELGLRQTYFVNESGLDAVERFSGGAYGSAQDVALLFDYILKNYPEIFKATQYVSESFVSLSGRTHTIQNTNQEVSSLLGIIASKTGFTDLTGGNLAVVFEAGPMYPIVVVVLGSTQEERFEDVSKLISATLKSLYLLQ